MNLTGSEREILRPEILRRIEAMDDGSLTLLHRVLVQVEKERNWRELSVAPELDRRLIKYDRLPEIIHEVRAELRNK